MFGLHPYLPSSHTAIANIRNKNYSTSTLCIHILDKWHAQNCMLSFVQLWQPTIPCSFGTLHSSLLILLELVGVVSSGIEITSQYIVIRQVPWILYMSKQVLLKCHQVTACTCNLQMYKHTSLEPRLSVPDFVSQLWRKIARQNPERKACVWGYKHTCSFTVCFSVSISSSALALSAFSLCVSVATSCTIVQTIGKIPN